MSIVNVSMFDIECFWKYLIETTDQKFEQFFGKAFLQKVNGNQLTITKPNTVLNYMINMQKHDNVFFVIKMLPSQCA